MMPQVVNLFPFDRALEGVENRMPLFYVDHTDTAANIADLSSHEVHLARFESQGKTRSLVASSGASVFAFSPGFSSRTEIPLKITTLSQTIFTIQPEQRLADGQYIIVFGPVAAGGFEFAITCGQQPRRSTLRIDAETK
jgi:hypothetical protein